MPSALLGDTPLPGEAARRSHLQEVRVGQEDFEFDLEWWADSSSSLVAESQQIN